MNKKAAITLSVLAVLVFIYFASTDRFSSADISAIQLITVLLVIGIIVGAVLFERFRTFLFLLLLGLALIGWGGWATSAVWHEEITGIVVWGGIPIPLIVFGPIGFLTGIALLLGSIASLFEGRNPKKLSRRRWAKKKNLLGSRNQKDLPKLFKMTASFEGGIAAIQSMEHRGEEVFPFLVDILMKSNRSLGNGFTAHGNAQRILEGVGDKAYDVLDQLKDADTEVREWALARKRFLANQRRQKQ